MMEAKCHSVILFLLVHCRISTKIAFCEIGILFLLSCCDPNTETICPSDENYNPGNLLFGTEDGAFS